MNMKPDCLVCLMNQMLRVTKTLNCDDESSAKIIEESAKVISKLDMAQTPPSAAAILYPDISKKLNSNDPYFLKKLESTKKALELLPIAKEKIDESKNRLDSALRAAVAGNVIDFATEVLFDLKKEIEKIFTAEFAIDDKELFLEELKEAKRVLIIGDNVGEHIFDKLMMETISKEYPNLKIEYMVRGCPIINDVTVKEAKDAGIDKVAEIIDSGVDTPGFVYERANIAGKESYDKADIILSKGMGNFECLESIEESRIYFLFKVKCSVVANRIDKEVGDLICMKNRG